MYTSYQSIYTQANKKRTHHTYQVDVRRVRRFIVTALIVLALFIACGSIVQAWTQDKDDTRSIYKEVIVMNGDTLWGIAKEYLPADMDIRDFVNEIAKHNGIQGRYLMSGEVIEVHIYDKDTK